MIDDPLILGGQQRCGLLMPPRDTVVEPVLEARQWPCRFCVVEESQQGAGLAVVAAVIAGPSAGRPGRAVMSIVIVWASAATSRAVPLPSAGAQWW